MSAILRTEPLTRAAFALFGQVIEAEGAQHYPINSGNCERFHDLATIELGGDNPRPLISLMQSRGFTLDVALMQALGGGYQETHLTSN